MTTPSIGVGGSVGYGISTAGLVSGALDLSAIDTGFEGFDFTGFGGGGDVPIFAGVSDLGGAGGGFVLYPSRPNLNGSGAAYTK